MDRDAPPEWRGKFIRYKALKKALKECAAAAAAAADASEETVAASRAAEAGFFDLLKQELLRVNRCVVTQHWGQPWLLQPPPTGGVC